MLADTLARGFSRSMLVSLLALAMGLGCDSERRTKKLGDFCGDDAQCESGICEESICLDPDADLDGDGLKNGVEKNLTRTDIARSDSDGDGRPDGLEVGNASAPTDTDKDGVIDALESRLPAADPDRDCIPDEMDADNDVATVDNAILVELGCTPAGVCGQGKDDVVAGCVSGEIQCEYTAVAGWQAAETLCDGLDNDCNGTVDDGTLEDPEPASCAVAGVCGGEVVAGRACLEGAWACVYGAIPAWEAVESLCDQQDNDCDGATDEDLTGGACDIQNDEGTCSGTWKCAATGGGRVCDGPVPVAETCNGADDDCDGGTDEDLAGVACPLVNVFGTCQGVAACDGDGGTVCLGTPARAEACNGADDDCDGGTDEDAICNRTGSVKGVVRRLDLAVRTLLPIAATAGTLPLEGALVKVGSGAACLGTPAVGPFWQALTGADGTFVVALEPGDACAFIEKAGYQPARADLFRLALGEDFPLEVVLSPEAQVQWAGTVCGRVASAPPKGDSVAVPGALVTVLDLEGLELGATTADDHGLWCVTGLPMSQATVSLTVSVLKDGWYPASQSLALASNVVSIVEIALQAVPAEVTACVDEDFESQFDGSTDLGVPVGFPWLGDAFADGVGWNWLDNTWLSNPWFDGCVTMPAEESCEAGTTGCPLCFGNQTEACLPGAGTLPYAFHGRRAWWFGNRETGSYLPYPQSCGQTGKPVGGSLTSPWIPVEWVLDLRMAFQTAWEVESRDPKTDRLLLEVQTPAMDVAGTWSLVADLKGEPGPSGDDPTVGLSSGGLGRTPAWAAHDVDLSAWSGTSLRVRFRFDSVDGIDNAFRGWLVDQVRITGRGCVPMTLADSR